METIMKDLEINCRLLSTKLEMKRELLRLEQENASRTEIKTYYFQKIEAISVLMNEKVANLEQNTLQPNK